MTEQPPPSSQWSYPQQGFVPGPVRGTNGLAIASLVLSLIWCYWIGSILAIVFGHLALGQIKRSGGQQEGRGLAIAGLVIGWLSVAAAVVAALLAVVFWDQLSSVNSDDYDGVCNSERYWQDPDC